MIEPLLARLAALRGWRANAAAAALGAASALALPPIHALPLLLLAIPGLLALLGGVSGWRGALGRGFWFGFAHHVIGLYWITDAILIEAARFWWLVPLATPALAVVLAVFVAVTACAARFARPGWPRALTLAGVWTLADLLRQFVATGFPWNPLGADWAVPGAVGDVFLQPAAWIGVHGLTLATVLIAATPALGRRAMALGVAGLLAWGGFGVWRLSLRPLAVAPLTVVLVQGNIPQGQKWSRAAAAENFQTYLGLTRRALAQARLDAPGTPAVAVWPESASPYLLDADPNARDAVADAGGGSVVIAGSVRFDPEQHPRNSLMAIMPEGGVADLYDKWHLVPFGEYSPGWVPVAVQLVRQGGFAPGPGPRTLHIPGLPPAGALICYEAIFPAQVVDAADRPAWLVNGTNDAWFGNSSGPRQHLAAVRLRAVEEGLPVLRAANTGITAAFDGFGRELGRIGMGDRGTLTRQLPAALPPTPFAALGLVSPGVLAAAIAAWGYFGGRRRL